MHFRLGIFGAAHQLQAQLLKILGTSFAPEHLQLCQLPDAANIDYGKRLAPTTETCPAILFLVAPSNMLDKVADCLRSLAAYPSAQLIVVVSEAGNPQKLLQLLQLGAADFLVSPLTAADVLPRVWRAMTHCQEQETLVQKLKTAIGLQQIIGQAASFRAEIDKIPLVAKCDVGVMISGETGTGKEMYARAVHYLSPRQGHPFVPVNCGAIPAELFENELFGHERGAYTGAVSAQPGLIKQAEHGTLFLDEVDTLPHLAQIKLLRFLQDKEYKPLGGGKLRRADVRVIAAANSDLKTATATGKLRQDLYFRLNVVPVQLPPLRERRSDIGLLAQHFLEQAAAHFCQPSKRLTPDALRKLGLYDWPGNVRELEHVIERAVILSPANEIGPDALDCAAPPPILADESFQAAKARCVESFEKDYLGKLLQTYQGNISQAAKAACKDRRAFFELMRKHHINAALFK